MTDHPDWAPLQAREADAGETQEEASAILVTLWRSDLAEAEWIRMTTRPARRLQVDPDLIYGLTSRGWDYVYMPLSVRLPSIGTSAGTAQLRIDLVTPEILGAARALNPRTRCTFEVVRIAAPDVIEFTAAGLYVTAAPWDDTSVTLTLSPLSMSREPWPSRDFNPSHFPGLFA